MKLDTTARMIERRELVPASEFQALMGWRSRQAIWKATRSRRVFFMPFEAGCYFPIFYGDQAYEPKDLQAVTKILGDLPGGAKLQFFLTRKGSLGGLTPLQALAASHLAKVKDIAAAFSEVA